MHVDEAGSDDRAFRIEDLFVGFGREVLADLGDQAARDAHVAQRVEILRRIDHATAAQEH